MKIKKPPNMLILHPNASSTRRTWEGTSGLHIDMYLQSSTTSCTSLTYISDLQGTMESESRMGSSIKGEIGGRTTGMPHFPLELTA